MLEINTHDFIEEIFKLVRNRYENLYKKMQESGFNFDHLSKLTIKYTTVNKPKRSSYIKSPNWLECKKCNSKSKNINNRLFQYAFTITHQHKEIKNHPEQKSIMKLFIDLYNWNGIKHRIVIDHNYALFER